jgi:hypothetical protein
MKKEYQTTINVPAALEDYLSLNNLNLDYWNNCLDQKTQRNLEYNAREWLGLNLSKYENYFNIETKIDDISTAILPIVPKLCDHQGVIFIWTIPLHQADYIMSDALLFKTELQSVKSVVPDNCEVLIGQVHIYPTFVFISSVKYYNFIAKYSKEKRIELIKQVWTTLIDLFKDKEIYAASGDLLNTAHNLFNNKNIQREPYNRKLLKRLGFVQTTVEQAPNHFYLEPTDKIWKYEYKPCS